MLRRALNTLGSPANLSGILRLIGSAAISPWIYTSIALQIVSCLMWMLIVSREKLGVATATVDAGFYTLMALSACLVYGEALSAVQWTGIALVTLGVICISLGGVAT